MARNIPPQMAKILERLELDRPELVSTDDIELICQQEGITTPARIIASRLRDKGWILPTPKRGVWEFIPAAIAGPFSCADPLLSLKAHLALYPNERCALSMQAGAWALGLADRAPACLEVAFAGGIPARTLPGGIAASSYASILPSIKAKGVDVLPQEAIMVHLSSKPTAVRSWTSTMEWLPEIAYDLNADKIVAELSIRPRSVATRTGYLLQGLRPDIANNIYAAYPPTSKVRFGSRTTAIRNDERWKISDTLLPFDPRNLEDVR